MIKCFCPSCGALVKAEFFIPSKVKLPCLNCKASLLITAKDAEVAIKYPTSKKLAKGDKPTSTKDNLIYTQLSMSEVQSGHDYS